MEKEIEKLKKELLKLKKENLELQDRLFYFSDLTSGYVKEITRLNSEREFLFKFVPSYTFNNIMIGEIMYDFLLYLFKKLNICVDRPVDYVRRFFKYLNILDYAVPIIKNDSDENRYWRKRRV